MTNAKSPSAAPDRPLRVLLVEDDDVDRMRLHRATRKAGAPLELVDAADVASGRAALAAEKLDCAVIDFNLPDGTALDLLEFNQNREKRVPIVVLTGGDDDARALEALKLGAEDYLRKSEFDIQVFVRAVRYAIERHRLRSDLAATNARLARELEIGGNIQTAILPRRHDARGLEIAARMLPATEVGGDYYDVLPREDGCWIGIGDVAGHGMSAAVIMLMVQSVIAALCRKTPDAQPSEIVSVLNEVLYDNVRNRMQQTEHVTLTLLRWTQNGELLFAGAHEDIVLCRANDGHSEAVPTTGTWLGARHGIADVTTDGLIHLDVGDVMLLYSDGLIEAQSSAGEPFGLARVCRLLEQNREKSAADIHERIWSAVEGWMALQDDDLTLLVVRRTG